MNGGLEHAGTALVAAGLLVPVAVLLVLSAAVVLRGAWRRWPTAGACVASSAAVSVVIMAASLVPAVAR